MPKFTPQKNTRPVFLPSRMLVCFHDAACGFIPDYHPDVPTWPNGGTDFEGEHEIAMRDVWHNDSRLVLRPMLYRFIHDTDGDCTGESAADYFGGANEKAVRPFYNYGGEWNPYFLSEAEMRERIATTNDEARAALDGISKMTSDEIYEAFYRREPSWQTGQGWQIARRCVLANRNLAATVEGVYCALEDLEEVSGKMTEKMNAFHASTRALTEMRAAA